MLQEGLVNLLAAQLRELLCSAPSDTLPMTYQQVAQALQLRPPGTIQRVALALERLMEEDAEAQQPFIAALVVSRRGEDLPALGFFAKAVELKRFPADTSQHETLYRAERERALSSR